MVNENIVIQQTEKWIKSVVIDLNFCPFASKALLQKSIGYSVLCDQVGVSLILETLLKEYKLLDEQKNTETSFIILTEAFTDFKSYLTLVKKAEQHLQKNNYDGVYQIASFHPNYCFAGSSESDPANYTNRSPYPMLHILREESLTKALNLYPHPENIPDNNIELAHKKGLAYMQMLRLACFDV